jgi:pimeloyl-ACP methyl ester carboxylesterase
MDHLNWHDLKHGENNLWYEYNDSDTVIVFIHGFFSESSSTWRHKDKQNPDNDRFWPDLVRNDARFCNPSIFLGGYRTSIDSGVYGFEKCADEFFRALGRPDEFGRSPVMAKQRIILVCHSMGGIVARYMLERNREAFGEKQVGIVLIASPSYGSVHADRLAWLADLYNQQQALHLKWGDALLKDLDSRFKDLVNDRVIPNLSGVEACENHFVVHRKFRPDKYIVVTEESAARYFGAPKMLGGTDHFSAVKPHGVRHPSHELLVDFWHRYAQESSGELSPNPL